MDTRQGRDYQELQAQLEQQVREAAPSALAEKLLPLMRPAITLYPSSAKDAAIPVGTSKIGGLPDLPIGTAWPEGPNGLLRFAAQINLNQVKPYDLASELPGRGLLSFFFDLEPPFPNQVFLSTNDSLARLKHPVEKGLGNSLWEGLKYALLGTGEREIVPGTIEFDMDCQLPTPRAPELEQILTIEEKQLYIDVWEELSWDWGGHQLLGYPYSHGYDSDLPSSQESPFNGIRVTSRHLYQAHERLLFQLGELSSDSNSFWGVHGVLGFLIPAEAMKLNRFERCRLFHGIQ